LKNISKLRSKILITGSTGFLGKNILNFLIKEKFKIYDILRLTNKKKKIKN